MEKWSLADVSVLTSLNQIALLCIAVLETFFFSFENPWVEMSEIMNRRFKWLDK